MTVKELNAAMEYIDDVYLDLADAPQKEIIQMMKTKNMTRIFLIAAVIAMLAVTAYASGLFQVTVLTTGTSNSYSDFSQVEKAMNEAGFRADFRESFASGFTFELIRVQDTDGLDEDGSKVLSYKEMSAFYRNEDGMRVVLCAGPKMDEVPETKHAEGLSREVGGITATYWLDHYKMVPDDYEPTEADKIWMEQPGNFISYGSDEVTEETPGFLGWEKDNVHYFFMDFSGKISADTLFSMAEELILAE